MDEKLDDQFIVLEKAVHKIPEPQDEKMENTENSKSKKVIRVLESELVQVKPEFKNAVRKLLEECEEFNS